MSKIKIGILIKEFDKLSNYQLLIIEEIFSNPNLQLSLLIKDARKGKNNPSSLINRMKRLIRKNNILGAFLLKFQVSIEKCLFRKYNSTDKLDIISQLNSIETVYLKPKRIGFNDFFSDEDAENVSSFNLDVILRHGFNIIKGNILKSAKYGIWGLHHGDNSINRGMPAGFWEVLLNEPVVGVTLQQLTSELDGGLIIDKAFYNRHWSFVKTQNTILEASVSLLFKNLRQLQTNNYYPKKATVYYNCLYKNPNFISIFKYIFNFYSKLISILSKKIAYLIFGTRYNCWTLFIGKGDFLTSTLFKLNPVKMPKDEFWADPFIFKYKNEDYIFFENYSYKSKIGKISCGKIKEDQLVEISDVLDLGYHLSFPFIFESEGGIFLIPETCANKRLEIYKCINFPNEWVLYSTAFEGERIVDTHLYIDDNNQKWLFTNKQSNINCPMDHELYIYKFDNLNLKNLQPHKKNPVIINSKNARNAGAIFKYDNEIFRPSQANVNGVYGNALNINKINKLTIDEYSEETTITTYANFKKGLLKMHHLHQKDGLFVIDAAYKKR